MTTRYLVDDLNPTGYAQVVEELSSGGTVQRQYTYGLQRISQNQVISNAWTPSFYEYDGGGSVRLLTDGSGLVTDSYDYDAFGNEIRTAGSTPNEYLYRGEEYDSDLSMYYLRARYYNPATGRFLSQDPYAGNAYDPPSLHRYRYASGNPANRIDPTGLDDTVEYNLSDTSSLPSVVSGSASFNADDESAAETYDQNGNVLSTGGKSFTYDSENSLLSAISTRGFWSLLVRPQGMEGLRANAIPIRAGMKIGKRISGKSTSRFRLRIDRCRR